MWLETSVRDAASAMRNGMIRYVGGKISTRICGKTREKTAKTRQRVVRGEAASGERQGVRGRWIARSVASGRGGERGRWAAVTLELRAPEGMLRRWGRVGNDGRGDRLERSPRSPHRPKLNRGAARTGDCVALCRAAL